MVCIVDGDVLGAAVIPEGNRAFVPAETAGELRSVTPFPQPVEQGLALFFGPALEAYCG